MARSFLTETDVTLNELNDIFARIKKRKEQIKKRESIDVLKNKVVGLLFEKPSTRTRNGFESAVWRMGGSAIYMASGELQIKRGEPIKDTARILGGYMDCLVARVYSHDTVTGLAKFAGVPVINALSDFNHPTQVVGDFFTIIEVFGSLKGIKLTYIGDGNNVCTSLLTISAMTGVDINVACPKGYYPDEAVLAEANTLAKESGSKIQIIEDVMEASKGANVLYSDVWVSMGDDAQKEKRLKDLNGYQINKEVLKVAAKDAKVMHCLPAYRGLEITDEMMECPQSIIWQQGENKMHSAAGILDFFLTQ